MALAACSRSSEPASEQPRVELGADDSTERAPTVLRGRVLDADGEPARESSVGVAPEAAVAVDASGRFALPLASWRVRAPVVYLELRRELEGEHQRASVLVPSAAVSAGVELRWPASEDADPHVELVEADPAAQAWLDAHRWLRDAWREWKAVRDDPAAVAALWRRLAADIEATSDPHLRMLMQAAQFVAGHNDPEHGLDRHQAAAQALADLGLDDPRWAIWPMALPTAIYDAGRQAELADELDAAIAGHPQPEVAAYIAIGRYFEAIAEGDWAGAEATWAAVEARPELMQTSFGQVLASNGPDRRLAPGNLVPAVCVEQLGGGQLCLDQLAGLTVVEVWSEGCKGCLASFAKLRELLPQLDREGVEVELLTINPWQEGEAVASFFASSPIPGRHGWVRSEARDQLHEQLQIASLPILLIVDSDGRILDSSPALRPDTLEARLRHWHAR